MKSPSDKPDDADSRGPSLRSARLGALDGHPATFRPIVGDGHERPKLFEPALKQFPAAYRLGDPRFETDGAELQWLEARNLAMDFVLRILLESSWKNHLVLRGSRLLKEWFGDAARPPGDLDWLVQPNTLSVSDPQVEEFLREIKGQLATQSGPEQVEFRANEFVVDDIWTYDRAPGIRFVVPWTSPGVPSGVIQADFVFGEKMTTPPVHQSITFPDGGSRLVWVASKEQSLAWKLLWLQTDPYPQGKDLYDAVLLAESVPLRLRVLRDTFVAANMRREMLVGVKSVLDWRIDWENFQKEYPWMEGDADYWKARLIEALAPSFEETAET